MRNGKLMTTKVAAIALSSMMAISPLTAFASSGDVPAQIKDPYGDTIQEDVTGFLNDGGYIGDTRDFQANFKKTLGLLDIKNTDYIPSVPDVRFTYDIKSGQEADTKVDAVASYNGATVFAGDADKHIKTKDLLVDFSHTDKADGDEVTNGNGKGKDDKHADEMTRLIDFTVDEASFDGMDPGVYRFRLTERECIDLDENGDVKTATNPEDVKDDTEVVDAKYSTRYIDVAIGRKTANFGDDERVIQGIILHEVTFTERDGEPIKISEKKSEGYVPTSYEEEEENDKYTDTGKPKTYSRYDTFDLVVDKEVFGQGLTQADADKAYNIDITMFGPVGTKVKVVKMNGGTGAKVDDVVTLSDATKGDVISVALKNNEWIEVSGLPSGSEVTVKEDANDILSKIYTKTQSDKTEAAVAMDADNKLVASVDHDKVIAQAQAQGENNGVDNMEIEKVYTVEDKNTIDVNNVLIANERQPITVTGVVMNVAPYALMVIAAAVFAGLFISKKRQEEEI